MFVVYVKLEWIWNGPGMDQEWTWTGSGPELDNLPVASAGFKEFNNSKCKN